MTERTKHKLLSVLLLCCGLLIAAVNKFSANKPKKQEFGCAGCPSAEICGKACLNNGEEAAVND